MCNLLLKQLGQVTLEGQSVHSNMQVWYCEHCGCYLTDWQPDPRVQSPLGAAILWDILVRAL